MKPGRSSSLTSSPHLRSITAGRSHRARPGHAPAVLFDSAVTAGEVRRPARGPAARAGGSSARGVVEGPATRPVELVPCVPGGGSAAEAVRVRMDARGGSSRVTLAVSVAMLAMNEGGVR